MTTMLKTYSELISFSTFEDRYNYLKLNGAVGEETFGPDRYLNQSFYKSNEWKQLRHHIIVRDNGCDLGIDDRIIGGRIIIHHINPIIIDQVKSIDYFLCDPENLICVSNNTHQAIHYGDEALLILSKPIERHRNDTCPWK